MGMLWYKNHKKSERVGFCLNTLYLKLALRLYLQQMEEGHLSVFNSFHEKSRELMRLRSIARQTFSQVSIQNFSHCIVVLRISARSAWKSEGSEFFGIVEVYFRRPPKKVKLISYTNARQALATAQICLLLKFQEDEDVSCMTCEWCDWWWSFWNYAHHFISWVSGA